MPVDSRDKRSSAINVGSPWRALLPVPDGTIGQADRQHVPFMYRGITASGGAGAVVDLVEIFMPMVGMWRKKRRQSGQRWVT